jgi:hypothetical protein
MNPIRKTIVGATLVGLTLGGGAVGAALAAGSSSAAPAATYATPSGSPGGTSTGQPPSGTPSGPHQANGITETLLTGTTKSKAEAAAKAAVPGGTIVRSETDADGAKYEVHMTKSDGSQVTVLLDANFKVTATDAGMGPGGPGGH